MLLEGVKITEVIDWKLIGSCNLECLHCYGPPKDQKALPLEQLLHITDKFKQLGASWVVLTGGEPLLVPKIDRVMERLHENGQKIALSTNSSYFRRHQESIERHVTSLNLALDGSTAEVHARSRQDESSYHTAVDVLDHYKAHGERKPQLIRVGSVYCDANKDDFFAMVRLLEGYDEIIDTWKIYEIIDYEFQPELRQPILVEQGVFKADMQELVKHTKLARKIQLAPGRGRDKAYFMVNPKGQLIMPIDFDGVTREIPIADFLNDPLEIIVAKWQEHCEKGNYRQNHSHYAKLPMYTPPRMKTAIAVLGPPVSGKTQLVKAYAPRDIHIGEFAKSLPDNHPLKQACMKHWEQNKTFTPELTNKLLQEYPLPETEWVVLDGTPRNQEQISIIQEFFDVKAYAIVTIDDAVWEERARKASQERKDRPDSTYEKLVERKQRYEQEVTAFKSLPNVHYIDNSESLDKARTQLDHVITFAFNKIKEDEHHARIYGRSKR